MYTFLLRTLCAARKSPVCVYESCELLARCDAATAAARGVSNRGGVRGLGTSSVRLCEKKTAVPSSNQDDATSAAKEGDPTETSVTQKAERDDQVIKAAEQSEEPVVLKTDDGSAAQQQVDVKPEEVQAAPKQVKTEPAKSGKQGLIDLLGAMRVELTTKKKLPGQIVNKSYQSTPVSTPVAIKSSTSSFQQATAEASSQSVTLDPKLVAAAFAAASTLPNRREAESKLLKQLRQHEAVTESQKNGDRSNLGGIIADMRVRKNPTRHKSSPVNQIQFDDDGQGYTYNRRISFDRNIDRNRKNLFTGKRLNIFSPTTDTTDKEPEPTAARPTLWDREFANELSRAMNQTPRNGLEEMIQWTREGKLWQYPINNEAGLEEEASVSFHEHIFIARHLEEGFPSQGPVRHFMELVVTGLSRNPYLTVQQKKEHISWFRDYFKQKEEVLQRAQVNPS